MLRPHHFQQQDRYHETRLQRTAHALQQHLWGVRAIAWSADSLAVGSLRAEAMSLIFQDGELYDAPGADALPDALDLRALPAEQESCVFCAALPVLKEGGANVAASDRERDGARFATAQRDTPDLYGEGLSTGLAYLTKTVRLVPQHESGRSYLSIPVVKVRRTDAGGFEIDPGFMPPCVALAGATELQTRLRSLMEKMKAKIDALYGHHREPSKHVVEVRNGDISSFWLLHTLNAAYPPLRHFARFGELHPEQLFLQLLALAGGLLSFSKQYSLADLPEYDHAEPGPAFAAIEHLIRELVDTVISSKCFNVILSNDTNSPFHRGMLDAAKIDEKTLLYLAVSADMPAIELAANVPIRFKVGAPDDVAGFVSNSVSGIRLIHLAQVPAALPVRPETYYFALDSKSPLYQNMLKAQSVTVYVPHGFPGMKLEFCGIVG